MNKLIAALIAGLFAVSVNAFAADAAKTDAKPAAEAAAPATDAAKSEKPAAPAKKASKAKKAEEKKADAPATK
ncbi:MAG: hypothetical protein N2Z69_01750 [Methylophilaceae bacterium]|nr:hypothetical protein [Methylophilaceae bacterium]